MRPFSVRSFCAVVVAVGTLCGLPALADDALPPAPTPVEPSAPTASPPPAEPVTPVEPVKPTVVEPVEPVKPLVPPATATTATPAAPTPFDLHVGLNLRTDLGVHPLRLDGGVRYGAFDVVLVLDPMVITDGQASTDLLLQLRSDVGIAGIAGWRLTTVGIADGTQFQENLLLGVGMDLPSFFGGALRGQWGLELAMMLIKHGADLPSEVISFESGRHYIDLVNFAMFARFEFGWAP